MHIPDGVLSAPVLMTGGVATAAGLAISLKALTDEALPRVAVLSAMFFAASLVSVPIGITSVHLLLSTLMGMLLGRAIVPAVFLALLLQAIFFGFGGLTAIGVNTVMVALPGLVAGTALRQILRRTKRESLAILSGGICAALSVCATVALLATALIVSNPAYAGAALVAVTANIPLLIAESVITAFAIAFLLRARPELFGKPAGQANV